MAKDVSNKSHAGNNFGDTSPSILDSQKVPPLRIVLNTAAGNQKTPATNSTVAQSAAPQQDSQPARATSKSKQQDSKQQPADSGPAKGGRFRIKLSTNKQQASKTTNNCESTATHTLDNEEKQNSLTGSVSGFGSSNTAKEESSSTVSNKSSNYLRRITRRSQRSVQVITNEDEESISSMTSTDENQNTQINNSDSNPSQEILSTGTAGNSTSTNGPSTATVNTNSQGVESPRKYKRRRGETCESVTNEQLLFGLQNYNVPVQNSFKLFKNIRQQVDKKLDTLNTALHPKAPRGFREYMLAKGAYILDGNRLGNGSNLTINEHGGMNIASVGKSNSRRVNKVNYFIPDRAKVPLTISSDSPLRDLFIEQEKERYRMRMQHIKEREKLTIAAEQEIMRVYNQATMAYMNQVEPLSVCTMLKHQEIYNYMDSNGVAIHANEENSQDEMSQEGVRTRRRQHEHVSPSQVRKTSNAEENQPSDIKINEVTTEDLGNFDTLEEDGEKESVEKVEETTESIERETTTTTAKKRNASPESGGDDEDSNVKNTAKKLKTDSGNDSKSKTEKELQRPASNTTDMSKSTKSDSAREANKELPHSDGSNDEESSEGKKSKTDEGNKDEEIKVEMKGKNSNESDCKPEKNKVESEETSNKKSLNQTTVESSDQPEEKEDAKIEETLGNTLEYHKDSESDLHSQCKEVFVVQLQKIDDKWEKIRAEMLIRHRNEAESLHAVQLLEWEWKTNEIGAIDVRSTLVINDVLVPKLAIYSQDY